MSQDNDLFADAARQVLADQCTPPVVRAIESGGRAAPATQQLWAQLEATGLADALLPEDDGGAGLGLSIARAAVTAHKGRISARNAAPSGLSVRIELPRAST